MDKLRGNAPNSNPRILNELTFFYVTSWVFLDVEIWRHTKVSQALKQQKKYVFNCLHGQRHETCKIPTWADAQDKRMDEYLISFIAEWYKIKGKKKHIMCLSPMYMLTGIKDGYKSKSKSKYKSWTCHRFFTRPKTGFWTLDEFDGKNFRKNNGYFL